jgi:hypothetical protein
MEGLPRDNQEDETSLRETSSVVGHSGEPRVVSRATSESSTSNEVVQAETPFRGLSMRGEAGAEVARNIQRIALGLVSIDDLGPGYARSEHGLVIDVAPETFPLEQVEPMAGHDFAA